jgi:hypothetical protein
MDLWTRLIEEGNFPLIEKLRHVERQDPGFGTITVPPAGFSQDDGTHNQVLTWLHRRRINILNPDLKIQYLSNALPRRS